MASVIWFGPVSRAQAQQADASYVTCTGDGSPTCGAMADANGRSLDRLGQQLGIDPSEYLLLRAFSAGGSAIKRYLENPESRARVRVVTLSDGTYEEHRGYVSPGFLAYALECLDGSKLFVATASSAPNKDHPNGAEVLEALRQRIEQESGQTFEDLDALPGVEPRPVRAWKLGGIFLADYGATLRHPEHATILAPVVWSGLVVPWLEGSGRAQQEIASSSPSAAPVVAGVVLALLVGAGIAVAVSRS
jgi:hypothetical protein